MKYIYKGEMFILMVIDMSSHGFSQINSHSPRSVIKETKKIKLTMLERVFSLHEIVNRKLGSI